MIFEINTKDEFYNTLINEVGLNANQIHNILDEFGYMIYRNDFKVKLKVFEGEQEGGIVVTPSKEVGIKEEEDCDSNRLYFEFKEDGITNKKEILYSELEALSWFEVLEYMFEFLRGCGYRIDGNESYEKISKIIKGED